MADVFVLIKILQQLSEDGPMQPETVASRIGIPLARDPAASDTMCNVFVGAAAGDGPVRSATLTCPASPLAGTACSLSLKVDTTEPIGIEAVRDAYGLESQTIVPSPSQPDSPMALWYRRNWADVLFSFSTANDKLISITVDEQEP